MPHEKRVFKQWVAKHFSEAWGEEFECSFKEFPVTAFVALMDNKIVGFACYEVTCRGYFGPTGVLESERGKGIGKELMFRSMLGLRELGYAYAIIGSAGPIDFYVNSLGAIPIPDSGLGTYPKKLSGN
jgi:predicted N-acetyltransferase YhbS